MESDNNPEEENDDPNMPENTDDDISDDEDNEILHNMAENDSAIETGNLRNFPDLLRIHSSGQDTNSGITNPDEETLPPSRYKGARPKEPLPIGSWPRRNNPPLREVVLPQLPQTPCPKGVCVPPYDEPPEPWCGFGSENELMDFLSERIPMCEEHSVTNTAKLVERETKTQDPIKDMEKYIHTVLDSDDEEAIKCKLEHNTALAMNTQVHIIHDNLEHFSEHEKEKIEEMEKITIPNQKTSSKKSGIYLTQAKMNLWSRILKECSKILK